MSFFFFLVSNDIFITCLLHQKVLLLTLQVVDPVVHPTEHVELWYIVMDEDVYFLSTTQKLCTVQLQQARKNNIKLIPNLFLLQ
jgi:hypothetical protein